MDNNKKFELFLESLKGHGHDSLIESVKKGFFAINENSSNPETNGIYNGYIEAILWTEEDGEAKDKTIYDISSEAMNKIESDVDSFYKIAKPILDKLPEEYTQNYGDEQIGHDLWLTRNGHGAGFWDRGLGELGDKLTKIAESMGEIWLVSGDDGQLYLSQ